MLRLKLSLSLLALAILGAVFAAPMPSLAANCSSFSGTYSFMAWDPGAKIAASGVFTVSGGLVLPGGIIECNDDGTTYQASIESGNAFL